ncbi:hypothetical protein GA0061080_10331, partial [Gilliamella intestini]
MNFKLKYGIINKYLVIQKRQQILKCFINFYNTAKLHKMILGKTPYAFLEDQSALG